jgi:hypothetical protein
VVIDLWSEIIKYMCHHQYALGRSDKIYSGYRNMTKDEFEYHKHKFLDYYWTNRGLYVFDKMKQLGGSNYLQVDNYTVTYDLFAIHFRSVKKNEKTTIDNEMATESLLLKLRDKMSKRSDFASYDNILTLLVPNI